MKNIDKIFFNLIIGTFVFLLFSQNFIGRAFAVPGFNGSAVSASSAEADEGEGYTPGIITHPNTMATVKYQGKMIRVKIVDREVNPGGRTHETLETDDGKLLSKTIYRNGEVLIYDYGFRKKSSGSGSTNVSPEKSGNKKRTVVPKNNRSVKKKRTSTAKTNQNRQPIVSGKKYKSEDEFRKANNIPPRTTKEKVIEVAVKGLTTVGVLGLLYFVFAPTKVAATSVASTAVGSAVEAYGSSGASGIAGGGDLPIDGMSGDEISGEVYTEADVELPEPPKPGETRSYTDENGSRWTEVYDGQNWVDHKSYDAAKNQIADNQEWMEKERIKQQSHDTAFDRELAQNKVDLENQISDIHKRNMGQIRENLELVQSGDEMLQAMNERALQRIEKINDVIDTGKALADVALPVIGAAVGGAPAFVAGTGYTIFSEIGAGVGNVIADPTRNIVAEVGKGVARGAVNVIVGEGLNSAMSLGGKALSAGLKSGLDKAAFKKAFSSTPLNPTIPVEELRQMYRNLKNGVSVSSGTGTKLANKSITQIGKILSGKGGAIPRTQGAQLADQAFSDIKDGVYSSIRGNLVDSRLGGAINERLWGKT